MHEMHKKEREKIAALIVNHPRYGRIIGYTIGAVNITLVFERVIMKIARYRQGQLSWGESVHRPLPIRTEETKNG